MVEKKRKKKEMIPVMTKISQEQYEEYKASRQKLNHIIGLGLYALKNNPQLIGRIHELETTVEYQKKRMDAHYQLLFKLQERLDSIEKKSRID